MSNTTEKTAAEKYLAANKFEPNFRGLFIYTSAPGHHEVDLATVLEDFHSKEDAGKEDAIRDLERQVYELKDEVSDLEDKFKEAEAEAIDDREKLEIIASELTPATLLDEKKLEILKRLYKFTTLEELEAVETPFKERTGYLDLIY